MTAPLRQLGGWSLNEAVQLLLRLSKELQALDTEVGGRRPPSRPLRN